MKLSIVLLRAFALVAVFLPAVASEVDADEDYEDVEWPDVDQRYLQKHATAAPTPAPAPTTVNVQCFTGDSRVEVRGKGMVAMEDLQVGDVVRTARGYYQPIYAFGHYQPNQVGEFLYLETQVPFEPLKMTGEHLVFVQGKVNPVRADSVEVGDVLVRDAKSSPAKITSIHTFYSRGMFTPLCSDGTLMVDGFAVSSYITLQGDQPEWVSFPIVGTNPGWSHHNYVHWTLAPFRVFCRAFSSEICQLSTEQGIPHYIEWGIGMVQWAHEYGGIVEVVFLVFALALFAGCRLVEVVFLGGPWSFVAAAVTALVLWNRKVGSMAMTKDKKLV